MAKVFRIVHQSKKSRARVGELHTAHGVVKTPAFMTIATRGAVKTLTAQEMRGLGADIILANTYHLFVRPGMEVIKKSGGLHKFMGWDGPILTDSGGYQVFSLAAKNKEQGARNKLHNPPQPSLTLREGDQSKPPLKIRGGRGSYEPHNDEPLYDVRITRDGAEFTDRKSGRKDLFTPEQVLQIQQEFGVDIAMVLDVCAPYPVSKAGAREAMEMTSEWARRSKIKNVKLKMKNLVFGIVQGSVYRDLREQSARDITALNFDGYAIGGVAVGGELVRQKRQVVEWVVPHLPEDKPRYLMGLGQPEEIVWAVRQGIDMFDCVLPTRNARHGNLYVWCHNPPQPSLTLREGDRLIPPLRVRGGKEGLRGKFYTTLHITNEKYRADLCPPDPYCSCFTCTHHTRAYLRHLFKVGEPLAARLATIHNVQFYLDLMKTLQLAIVANTL